MENRVTQLEARVAVMEGVIENLTTSHQESDRRLPAVYKNKTMVDNVMITTAVNDLNSAVFLRGEGPSVAGALRALNNLLLMSASAAQVALGIGVTADLSKCLTSESADERKEAILCVKTLFAAQPKGNEQLLPIVAVLIKHITGKVFSSLDEQRSVLGHIEAVGFIAFQSKHYQYLFQGEGAVTALSRMILRRGIGERDPSVHEEAIKSLKIIMKASDPREAQGWLNAVMRQSIDSNAKLSCAIEWVLVHLLAFPRGSIQVSSNAIVILLNCLEYEDIFLKREAIWMLRVAASNSNYKEKILGITKFHDLSYNLLSTASMDIKKTVADLLIAFCHDENSNIIHANLSSVVGSLRGFIELAKTGLVGNDAVAIGMGLRFMELVAKWVPEGPNLIATNGGLELLMKVHEEKKEEDTGMAAKVMIDTYFQE